MVVIRARLDQPTARLGRLVAAEYAKHGRFGDGREPESAVIGEGRWDYATLCKKFPRHGDNGAEGMDRLHGTGRQSSGKTELCVAVVVFVVLGLVFSSS